jgi:hypothetical protein
MVTILPVLHTGQRHGFMPVSLAKRSTLVSGGFCRLITVSISGPKSRKRYSELKIKDLEHSFTRYMMTDFFKHDDPLNYQRYSKILLRMSDAEFSDYETTKYQYETK